MSRDQSLGAIMLLVSVLGIAVYAWLLYTYSVVVLQVTAFIAVAGIFAIAAWIGYTMATTPPPAPLESEPPIPQTQTGTTNAPTQ
jgi:predicted DNA-binding transcriptional regulator